MSALEQEPLNSDLDELAAEADLEAAEPETPGTDSLDDLFAEATQHRTERKLRQPSKPRDPSLWDALDSMSKKLKEIYSNPENWKAARGLVLIDKESKSVIGNFREYLHTTTTARILRREHSPIQIDGQEIVEGYLGHQAEEQFRGITWDSEKSILVPVLLDEIQVEAPAVAVKVYLQFGLIRRAVLEQDTQFANGSSTTLLQLPAGTNIWDAANSDSKAAMRKAALA